MLLVKIKAVEQSIPGMADQIGDLCRKTLSNPIMDRVRRAKRFFREVPFSVSLEGKIMEGKIDLLFEEDEGWVIVDYKTDEVSGKAINERFDLYREQGIWYARAAEKTTGEAVKEVAFFFVRTGEIRVLRDLGKVEIIQILIESQRGFNAWKCLINRNKLLLKRHPGLPQVGFFDCHLKTRKGAELPEKSEPFEVSHPPRQPISPGIDPLDLSIPKRIAAESEFPSLSFSSCGFMKKSSKKRVNPGS